MTSAVGWRTAALAVAVALLPACRSTSKAEGPTATLGTAAPVTTTTTTNPYAVPTVIDAAYVNRVLAGLDAVVGDTTRLVIRTKTIPREAFDRLRAVYQEHSWLQLRIDNYQDDIREGFSAYRQDPGNKRTTVVQLLAGTSSCVFARVQRDYSPVGVSNALTADVQWIALKPLDMSRDPNHYNPTSWAFIYDGYPPDRSQPPNPCAS